MWKGECELTIMEQMTPDSLLDTAGHVDSLTLERASFHRRWFIWREGERRFTARYSWNADGLLSSREEDGETRLYAYTPNGELAACYRLNEDGQVTARETWERDKSGRPLRRIMKTMDPAAEEIWIYEHDPGGRVCAERRGKRVRVEKRDRDGRITQEYLYDGERPDLVTEYEYTDKDKLSKVTIRDPDGTVHRRITYVWDELGRLSAEKCIDSENRAVKDETYAYGATHENRWLERVSWIPTGHKKGKRRPFEVIYRSFTLQGEKKHGTSSIRNTIAFPNGVFEGSVVGKLPEGEGVFQYNDESRYEGTFRNGVMEGHGLLSWPDGRIMEGNFVNGRLEGEGHCLWPDGSSYTGHFAEGRMDGPGVFIWADGTRFTGLFEKGHRTAQGAWERAGDK